MRTKRLLVALELPPSCAETLAELDPGVEDVHWVPKEQMHLPMSLKWRLDESEEERLYEALAHVTVHPFFIPLQGLGMFGKSPAIAISVGIGTGHPLFFGLHRHIQDAALHARLEADLRPFHPHVTVARTTDIPKAKFRKLLREYAETEFCMWKVTGFSLYRVEEAFGEAVYSVERRFPESHQ